MWTLTFKEGKSTGSKEADHRRFPGVKGFLSYRVTFSHEVEGRNLHKRGGYARKRVEFDTWVWVAVDFDENITKQDVLDEQARLDADERTRRLYGRADMQSVRWKRMREAAPEMWQLQEYFDAILLVDSRMDKKHQAYESEADIKKLFNAILIPNPGYAHGGTRWLQVQSTEYAP